VTTFERQYPFDWVYLDTAREELDALSHPDKLELIEVIESLYRDPWDDFITKFPLDLEDGDALLSLFDDGRWLIVYQRVSPRLLLIHTLSPTMRQP